MYSKHLQRTLNIGIVLACVLLVTSLAQRYRINKWSSGRTISVRGVEFARSNKTLLLFLQQDCGPCVESIPFYRRLVETFQDSKNVRLVLITPHQPELTNQFLEKEGLRFDTVLQAKKGELGVKLSPTLILADATGTIHGSWIGQLSPQQEIELCNMLAH